MPQNIRPVRRQHTVTKSLLKQFADRQGKLAVYERRVGKRHLRSAGAGVFTMEFDTYDSRFAEDRWNVLENQFPKAFQAARNRSALQDAKIVATLKDMIALHWARSIAIMVARERMFGDLVEKHKRDMLTNRPDLVARALKAEVGIVATTSSALDWMNDRVYERSVRENLARWNSGHDRDNFEAARRRAEKFEVQIGYARERDLVIGDCPVITTHEGHAGTGPHQGVAFGDADHIAMPISPSMVIALGSSPGIVNLDDAIVDLYNQFQWDGYHSWIAAKPSGPGDLTLQLEAARVAAITKP